MDKLLEIRKKLVDLRQKSRDGLVFESLGDLMLVIKNDVNIEDDSPVILPEDGDMALEQIQYYQKSWAEANSHDEPITITDSDLRLIVKQLGSPWGKYRDTGAFFFLGGAIQNNHLSAQQLAWLTAELLKSQNLFSHLLQTENDGAYQRSYHIALLSILLSQHRTGDEGFIFDQLMSHLVDQVALIMLMERDTRGYIDGKGWVHIFTHFGNLLQELFLTSELVRADKIFLTSAIMANFRSLTTALTMGEVSRLVGALVDLSSRHSIYAEYMLTNLKLWRQDIVNEPFVQNHDRWQQMYNRMQFFHEIIVCGEESVPEVVWNYVVTTKNYLS